MLKGVASRDGTVGVCGFCMDARGLADGDLTRALLRSSLDKMGEWTLWADKVIVS